MNINDACNETGFAVCEFGPDSDPCEKCGLEYKQHYWRRTDPFSMDGEYFCTECVIKEAEENAIYDGGLSE